jgi:hypothetical protein
MSIEPTKPEGFVGHYRPKMRPGLKLYAGGEANFLREMDQAAGRRTGVLG